MTAPPHRSLVSIPSFVASMMSDAANAPATIATATDTATRMATRDGSTFIDYAAKSSCRARATASRNDGPIRQAILRACLELASGVTFSTSSTVRK